MAAMDYLMTNSLSKDKKMHFLLFFIFFFQFYHKSICDLEEFI